MMNIMKHNLRILIHINASVFKQESFQWFCCVYFYVLVKINQLHYLFQGRKLLNSVFLERKQDEIYYEFHIVEAFSIAKNFSQRIIISSRLFHPVQPSKYHCSEIQKLIFSLSSFHKFSSFGWDNTLFYAAFLIRLCTANGYCLLYCCKWFFILPCFEAGDGLSVKWVCAVWPHDLCIFKIPNSDSKVPNIFVYRCIIIE